MSLPVQSKLITPLCCAVLQAHLRMHTYPRPAFQAFNWTDRTGSCLPDHAPKRDLPFSIAANLYDDSEKVRLDCSCPECACSIAICCSAAQHARMPIVRRQGCIALVMSCNGLGDSQECSWAEHSDACAGLGQPASGAVSQAGNIPRGGFPLRAGPQRLDGMPALHTGQSSFCHLAHRPAAALFDVFRADRADSRLLECRACGRRAA